MARAGFRFCVAHGLAFFPPDLRLFDLVQPGQEHDFAKQTQFFLKIKKQRHILPL